MDIDAELDDLEESVRGDDEDEEEDEEDAETDEEDEDGQAQPDFAPYDRSLKKKAGMGRRTGSGLGANAALKNQA